MLLPERSSRRLEAHWISSGELALQSDSLLAVLIEPVGDTARISGLVLALDVLLSLDRTYIQIAYSAACSSEAIWRAIDSSNHWTPPVCVMRLSFPDSPQCLTEGIFLPCPLAGRMGTQQALQGVVIVKVINVVFGSIF